MESPEGRRPCPYKGARVLGAEPDRVIVDDPLADLGGGLLNALADVPPDVLPADAAPAVAEVETPAAFEGFGGGESGGGGGGADFDSGGGGDAGGE